MNFTQNELQSSIASETLLDKKNEWGLKNEKKHKWIFENNDDVYDDVKL